MKQENNGLKQVQYTATVRLKKYWWQFWLPNYTEIKIFISYFVKGDKAKINVKETNHNGKKISN